MGAESVDRAEELIKGELLDNTKRSYRQALRVWSPCYRVRYGSTLPLPVPAPVVQQLLLDFTAHRLDPAKGAGQWGCKLPRKVDDILVRMRVKSTFGPWSLNTVEIVPADQ